MPNSEAKRLASTQYPSILLLGYGSSTFIFRAGGRSAEFSHFVWQHIQHRTVSYGSYGMLYAIYGAKCVVCQVLTGAQIRSARALLRWSAQETARRTGVSKRTLDRLEQHDGVPPAHSRTLAMIQGAFEATGVEFVGNPEEGPGVRLWQKHGN
jgi:hypothetical protein